LIIEIASLVTAVASLVVAGVAGVLAYKAWTRPFPADPTQIPTWGTIEAPESIASPIEGEEFFAFLRDNAGRKVRIHLALDPDYFTGAGLGWYAPTPASFRVPSTECPDVSLEALARESPVGPACMSLRLSIQGVEDDSAAAGDQRTGLQHLHGTWLLSGYFANPGFSFFQSNDDNYRITPLTDVEAVN